MSGTNGNNGSHPTVSSLSSGELGSGDAGEREEEYAIGEIPTDVFELAEQCRQYVLGALGVELDYEPETLPVLDEYLRTAAQGIADRPELEPLVTRSAAAYFGEVVRRRIDSFWRKRKDLDAEWELCARRALLSVSPRGMVCDALARSEERPGPSSELVMAPDDRAMAEARLSMMPEVSEEEYYLLSTRLEVLEVVYETLRDQMKKEGRESIVFEESDYEDE